jgi:hypothetical protein
VAPEAITDLVARWLAVARREPRALDAVAQLARTAPLPWQTSTGLTWAEALIDSDYVAMANRCWFLTDWLDDIRATTLLDAEAAAGWRRLVDGLAAEGDNRAAKLQQAEE